MHLDCIFKHALQSITEKVLITDSNDCVVFANKPLRKKLGFPEESPVSVGGNKVDAVVGEKVDLINGKEDKVTYVAMLNASGNRQYFNASISQYRENDGTGCEYKISFFIIIIIYIIVILGVWVHIGYVLMKKSNISTYITRIKAHQKLFTFFNHRDGCD